MSTRVPGGRVVCRAQYASLAAAFVVLILLGNGCGPAFATPTPGTLLVTQVPSLLSASDDTDDGLDLRYPMGRRIVRVNPADGPTRAVVLTPGLQAAGDPAMGPDGRTFLFVGQTSPSNDWQIYRGFLRGQRPEALTALPGGAKDPAWLPGSRFVFSSPVPRAVSKSGEIESVAVPALYTLAITGGVPVRLTFGTVGATDPTVLADGRILLVSSMPGNEPARGAPTSLFTINNDGTEITAFAGQHDPPAVLRRPRESDDGRILFLAAEEGTVSLAGRMEQVLSARPFRSRAVTFPALNNPCRSVEPMEDGSLLVSLGRSDTPARTAHFAIFRLAAETLRLGESVLDDPAWDDVEAVLASRKPRSAGRLSTVDPNRRDAALLCLDAHFTDRPKPATGLRRGTTIRLFQQTGFASVAILGETRLQADGSFLVTVPADLALGVELLDDQGTVLQRCPPSFWLRPGENRACVGCHEPHNRSPENARPLAVLHAPVAMLPVDFHLPPTPALSPR